MPNPGGYARAMVWLRFNNTGATIRQLGVATGMTDTRALRILRAAEKNGDVRRSRKSPRDPWQWEPVTDGEVRSDADTDTDPEAQA